MTNNNTRFDNYAYALTSLNAARTPDKTALTYRGERYSFARFNATVNQTANALLALGVKPGDHIGVLLHDALPIAETYLALAKIGATIIAINPYWDDDTMQAMLEHCEANAMLTQQCDSERMQPLRAAPGKISNWIQLEAEELPADTGSLLANRENASTDEPALGASGSDPLAFFFTSGTTGLPKAVIHTHSSCRAMADIFYAIPQAEDSMWGTGTIIWGIGFPCTIGAALHVGMPIVLEDDFGPAGLLDAIQRQPISHFCVIPSFFSDLLGNHPHDDIDLDSVRVILLGGEPLAENLLKKIQQRLPGAGVYSFYGQTEAPYTCIGRLDDGSQASNSSGIARPSCAAQVLDPAGKPVQEVPGELAVTGPHLMTAYYRQPEKTDEALRDGWFFSGDLAIQGNDGRITVLGRREDAIVREGQFVQPLTIEDVVLGIGGVTEAGAVGVARGDEHAIVLAVTTVDNGPSEEDIASALADKLPAHARPDRIVIADELPHSNDNSGGKGKLLRREIRERYAHLVE